jgi:hypothetical protein
VAARRRADAAPRPGLRDGRPGCVRARRTAQVPALPAAPSRLPIKPAPIAHGGDRSSGAGTMGGCLSKPEAPQQGPSTGPASPAPPGNSSSDPLTSSDERNAGHDTPQPAPAASTGGEGGGAEAQDVVVPGSGGSGGAGARASSSLPARTKLQMQLLGDVRGGPGQSQGQGPDRSARGGAAPRRLGRAGRVDRRPTARQGAAAAVWPVARPARPRRAATEPPRQRPRPRLKPPPRPCIDPPSTVPPQVRDLQQALALVNDNPLLALQEGAEVLLDHFAANLAA